MNEEPLSMTDLTGKTVRNAARPEWGNGTVLTVKPTTANGKPAHRVTIQFLQVGHKTLMVPPARLIPRENLVEEETPETWIEQIAGRTPDERLRALPEAVTQVLGTLAQRVAALGPLYEIHETDDRALMRWAKSQSKTADPLTHWSKDELHVAFRAFCQNRDDHLRIIIAEAKQARGPTVVDEALTEVCDPVREAMLEVLRRPI